MNITYHTPEARELQSRLSEFTRYNATLPNAGYALTDDDQGALLRASPVVDANHVGKAGLLFRVLRNDEINARMALYGVTQNPRQFPDVPEHALTTEVVLTALHARPGNIAFVDLNDASKFSQSTREIFVKTAVTADYRAISLVPPSYRSIPDIAWEALRQSPLAIRYIPVPTLEMASSAIERDPRTIGLMNLNAFSEADREALMLSALKKDVSLFRSIPEEFRTYNICWAAVLQDGKMLDSVPEDLRSVELCGVALSNGGEPVHVPEPARAGLFPKEGLGSPSSSPSSNSDPSAHLVTSQTRAPSRMASEGAMTSGMRALTRRLVASLPRRTVPPSPSKLVEPVLFITQRPPVAAPPLTFESADPRPSNSPAAQKPFEAAPVLSARP